MISFRYHLVSIVAVFLALALGIVVGTTALNGPITKDLRNQVNDTKTQRDRLAGQVKTLQGQVSDAGEFASTYGSQLVTGRLTGKPVLVLSLPGTSSGVRSGVVRELAASGARVGGQVAITKDYLDPSLGGSIVSLVTNPAVHVAGVTLPTTSDPGQLGGALLAYVLAGKGQSTDVASVLGGFSELHMVSTSGTITPAANMVVLGEGTIKTSSYAASTELSLVTALTRAGAKVVVAGNSASAQGGGLVAQVRGAGSQRSAVASVDDADSAFGQVSTVLALADVLAGQVGHYGTQQGADALYPTPSR